MLFLVETMATAFAQSRCRLLGNPPLHALHGFTVDTSDYLVEDNYPGPLSCFHAFLCKAYMAKQCMALTICQRCCWSGIWAFYILFNSGVEVLVDELPWPLFSMLFSVLNNAWLRLFSRCWLVNHPGPFFMHCRPASAHLFSCKPTI